MADVVQDKLDPAVAKKFAVNRTYNSLDCSRSGTTAELRLDELCMPEDLLVVKDQFES